MYVSKDVQKNATKNYSDRKPFHLKYTSSGETPHSWCYTELIGFKDGHFIASALFSTF